MFVMITITVTAPSGAVRTYTISVTRQQGPNYVPSNSNVASITVDGFFISPPFSQETRTYVVWLPYETTQITVVAVPESDKASTAIEGGGNLQEGDNEITIICTAEDGTAQTLVLIAKRAAQAGGGESDTPDLKEGPGNVIFYILMPVCLAAGLAGGFGLSKVFKKKPDTGKKADTY